MSKAEKMRKLFSGAPKEYDALLSRLTLQSDAAWRKEVVDAARNHGGSFVLDVATGTGLMAFDLARKLDGCSAVIGIDLCQPMLSKAAASRRRNRKDNVSFISGCAEALPFMDGCFDCATITLALRNVTNPEKTFEEMSRVVKTGGSVISMDFSRPRKLVWPIYNFHISYLLPFIGWLVSAEWKEIFVYLAGSIKKSMDPVKIGQLMQTVGLSDVTIRRVSMGVVSIVKGSKSVADSGTAQTPNQQTHSQQIYSGDNQF